MTDPTGPTSATHRVLRGGSWLTTGGQCRSARRNHEPPWAVHRDIGFRVVCGAPPNRFNPGPGIGIQMRNGRQVIPGYTGEVNDETDEEWYSRVLYNDDHGKTWTLGQHVPELSDECQAVELADGALMHNMRGNMGKSCRGVAISKDSGQTWSCFHWDRALRECPYRASLVRYSFAGRGNRNRLLFANPDNAGEKFGVVERTRMTVRMSYDEEKTWPIKRLIHAGPSSYSTMVRLPDGDIGLLFEGGDKHRREWIRFVHFSLYWLTQGEDQP